MAGMVETDEVEPRRAIRPEKRSGWWNHPPRLQPGGTSAAGSRTGGAQEKTRTSLRYADRRLSPWISAWRGSDLDYDHRGFGFLWRRRKLQYLLRAVFHKDTLASACRQRQGLYIPASRRYLWRPACFPDRFERLLWRRRIEAHTLSGISTVMTGVPACFQILPVLLLPVQDGAKTVSNQRRKNALAVIDHRKSARRGSAPSPPGSSPNRNVAAPPWASGNTRCSTRSPAGSSSPACGARR